MVVSVPEGGTVLEACDQAGRYVPRLCSYPGLGCGDCAVELSGMPATGPEQVSARCGLCVVVVGEETEEGEAGGGPGSSPAARRHSRVWW